MIVDITIGKLSEYIEEFKSTCLIDNQEVDVSDFGIIVPTPNKQTSVKALIKKCNLPMVELEFDNGYTIKVAKKHILQQHGCDIFADQLVIGSKVDHLNGVVHVNKISEVPTEDCFDISIAAPHLYYDANRSEEHTSELQSH